MFVNFGKIYLIDWILLLWCFCVLISILLRWKICKFWYIWITGLKQELLFTVRLRTTKHIFYNLNYKTKIHFSKFFKKYICNNDKQQINNMTQQNDMAFFVFIWWNIICSSDWYVSKKKKKYIYLSNLHHIVRNYYILILIS